MKHNHILLPVSVNQLELAQKLLDTARELIAKDGKITILNAQEPIPGSAKNYLPKDAVKSRDTDIREILQGFSKDVENCEVALVSGRAGIVVVDYAEENDVDCIVIASHRPELKDYFLGSTTSRVVRYANCSVYVQR